MFITQIMQWNEGRRSYVMIGLSACMQMELFKEQSAKPYLSEENNPVAEFK